MRIRFCTLANGDHLLQMVARDEFSQSIIKVKEMKIGEQIHNQVLQWPGVSDHPHHFGGREYRLGKREIGHIHGDRLVDIPFPKKVRDEIIAAGQAQAHHVLPDSGWVSFYLRAEEDVQPAVALLRRSYELAVAQQEKRRA